MKAYKDKSIPELVKAIAEKRDALRNFRFGNAGSKSKNVKEGRNLRKDVARMMTEISMRKIATK